MPKRKELSNDNYIGYKIKLYPTLEQELEFKRYFGACRYVYNLAINLQENYYKKVKDDNSKRKFLQFIDLNNKLTELKNTEEYSWLKKYDAKCLTYVLKDVINAYKCFFEGNAKYPRYKKKKFHHQMFPIRSDRLCINYNTVRIPSIGQIKCIKHNYLEIIGDGNNNLKHSYTYKHYRNSRIIFDGYSYWLCFSLAISKEEGNEPNSFKRFKNNEIWQHKKPSNSIGIDINGHRDTWIVLSNGKIYQRPDCGKEERQIKKYQRKLAIKQRVNKEKKPNSTVAIMLEEPNYTKNEEKILKKLNKAYKRKTNKKLAVIHECACDILEDKPEFFVMEDLEVNSMLIPKSTEISYNHRKNHNKMIYDSMPNTVQTIIERKLKSNDILVYKANKEFPSTQLCSNCGYRQKIGTKRIYECPHCGNIIDRDLNAAINLSNYFSYEEYSLYA